MPVAIDESAGVSTVRLDGDIGIAAALELKGALIAALASHRELRVELGGVTAVDITTLQLLWTAAQAAPRAGIKLHISGPIPEEMELAMGLAGLERFAVDPE